MSLPKLESPTFKMKLPSSGETISYRPFLVKEEKLLLMLGEEESSDSSKIELVKELITTCVKTEIDFNKLTTYDIEYIFLNLRSKSVGQDIELALSCSKCETKCPVTLDLDKDVFIENLKESKKEENYIIKIDNSIGLKMKHPAFSDIDSFTSINDDGDIISILGKCVESIYDDKTVYNIQDYTEKEVKEFLQSLSMKDIEKMKKFFDSIPRVKSKITFTCPSCGNEEETVVDGIGNFF